MEWVSDEDETIIYGVLRPWEDDAVYRLREAGIEARPATSFDPEDPPRPRAGLLERDTGAVIVPNEQVAEALALLRAWARAEEARVKQKMPSAWLGLARVLLVLALAGVLVWFLMGRHPPHPVSAAIAGLLLGLGALGEITRYGRARHDRTR